MSTDFNSTRKRRSPAFDAMASDILENVLRDADNPSALSTYLTQQMRELTGARTVILLQCLHTFGGTDHRLVCVNPERRRPLAESVEVDRLTHLVHDLKRATVWGRETGSGEAVEILAEMGCGLSIAVPLNVGAVRVGTLLLLDLPDAHAISLVVEVLDMLSTVIALVFRNALLYEEQEATNEQLRQEITARKRAEETIKQMAYHDALTGLPNRRLFNDRLNLAMAHAHRNQQKLAVMLLDLDHFKEVNDTLGHGVGDQLLQAVSERLTSLLRKGDTVARMGGDEFMLLLPQITQVEDAAEVAQKVLEAIREPYVFDGHELHVTTSIGIAMYPEDGEDGDTLMKNADIAMYRAKEQGRDNYQSWRPIPNNQPVPKMSQEQ